VLTLLLSCNCSSHLPSGDIDFSSRRRALVQELRSQGIEDDAVLNAIAKIPREEFMLPGDRERAYVNRAMPIEGGQTISQPYVVARMTELLEVDGDDRVLEVGTGSGYQAAVLATLVGAVYSIEIDPKLADGARRRLDRLGYSNVHVRAGDGFYGWPEAAPFEAAIVTAATPRIPERIIAQLKEGGRLVMPLDEGRRQWLVRGRKRGEKVDLERITEVIFVPMTGAVREPEP
jgi:protein-L-isoaspartate(D-aspartate) O-methyltransferase